MIGDERITVLSDPIPMSAKCRDVFIERNGDITFCVEDDSFREVSIGERSPPLCPMYHVEQIAKDS